MEKDLDRYHQLLLAIEEERQQEEQYYREISESKTDKEKIESGILLSNLAIQKLYYTIGEYMEIQLSPNNNQKISNKFKPGIGVSFYKKGEIETSVKATISFKRGDKIGIIIHSDVIQRDHFNEADLFNLLIVYDERPYLVMKGAMNDLLTAKEPHIVELRDGIKNKSTFDGSIRDGNATNYFNGLLNESQNAAVRDMMKTENIGVIHGPPGTGKTTTLVALTKALLDTEKKILVCAPSNNAVDLLASKLHQKGIRVLRIGNITRIDDEVAELSIDEQARNHPEWKHIKQVRIEAEAARKSAGTYKRTFGKQDRIDRRDMYREARDLKKWARELQNRVIEDVINNAQVIATTLVSVSNKEIKDLQFDTVLIDEASQCLEPECWNAMMRGKRTILAGDHHQLPPTIKSSKAKKLGLEVTLLDQLAERITHKKILTEQYRMNDAILQFSNEKFYNGSLHSHESNKAWTLEGDEHPLTFIDTSGCGYEEQFNPKTRSLKNEGEFFILREHILKHLPMYTDISIGIIAPYAEQAKYIREEIEQDEQLKSLNIKADTIDGFQGQEKDAIFISLTRSNDMGIIGFIADYRRLNVAMTRAKKKLVIIGDGATLSSNELYLDLINTVEQRGKLESAWEYMM